MGNYKIESEAHYVEPGPFIFGILFGTLTSVLMGALTRPAATGTPLKEVTSMYPLEEEGGYPIYSPLEGPINVEEIGEIWGKTVGELSQGLVLMEDALNYGESARLQLLTYTMPTSDDLEILHASMIVNGFHATKPTTRLAEGIPSTEIVIRKGSPVWAALIPLIPTAIIAGLITFGITRIEAISRALLPLMLVTVGGMIILVVLVTRKPVMETAQKYIEQKQLQYLPKVEPKKALAASL